MCNRKPVSAGRPSSAYYPPTKSEAMYVQQKGCRCTTACGCRTPSQNRVDLAEWSKYHRVKPIWMKENRKSYPLAIYRVPDRWLTEQRDNFAYYNNMDADCTCSQCDDDSYRACEYMPNNNYYSGYSYDRYPEYHDQNRVSQQYTCPRDEPPQSQPPQVAKPVVNSIPVEQAQIDVGKSPRPVQKTEAPVSRLPSRAEILSERSKNSPRIASGIERPSESNAHVQPSNDQAEAPVDPEYRRQMLESSIGYRPAKSAVGSSKKSGKMINKGKNATSNELLDAMGGNETVPKGKKKKKPSIVISSEKAQVEQQDGSKPQTPSANQAAVVKRAFEEPPKVEVVQPGTRNIPPQVTYAPSNQSQEEYDECFCNCNQSVCCCEYTFGTIQRSNTIGAVPQFTRIDEAPVLYSRGERLHYSKKRYADAVSRQYQRFVPPCHHDLNPRRYKQLPPAYTQHIRPAGQLNQQSLSSADCFNYFE